MKVYQVEASKLHASAVLAVQAENLHTANKKLTKLIELLGMKADGLIVEIKR